jgi:hypothetical protein
VSKKCDVKFYKRSSPLNKIWRDSRFHRHFGMFLKPDGKFIAQMSCAQVTRHSLSTLVTHSSLHLISLSVKEVLGSEISIWILKLVNLFYKFLIESFLCVLLQPQAKVIQVSLKLWSIILWLSALIEYLLKSCNVLFSFTYSREDVLRYLCGRFN